MIKESLQIPLPTEEFRNVYRDYVAALPIHEQGSVLHYNAVTPRDLLKHLEEETDIGQLVYQSMFIGQKIRLIKGGETNPTDDRVLEAIIDELQEIIRMNEEVANKSAG